MSFGKSPIMGCCLFPLYKFCLKVMMLRITEDEAKTCIKARGLRSALSLIQRKEFPYF